MDGSANGENAEPDVGKGMKLDDKLAETEMHARELLETALVLFPLH